MTKFLDVSGCRDLNVNRDDCQHVNFCYIVSVETAKV